MFKRFLIFLFIISCCALSAKPQQFLNEAEKAYDLKDYKKAIEIYEQLVKDGFISDKLFYNLGNAYYRDNQLGKAIYNYEKARKLNPDDQDVRNNLGIAYSKTIDKIESKENFFVSAVKTNVLSTFTTKTWAWLSIVTFALSMLFVYLFFAGVSLTLRRVSFFVAAVFFVSSIIIYSLGYSAVKAKQDIKFAIITVPQTKVFVEPAITSTSKFSLHEGTKVRLIELNADWVLIKLENGNEGWLKISDVGVF